MEGFPESSFQIDQPVTPDWFKEHQKDIDKILRQIPKVINQGEMEHYFVIGKRGIGKTSFVKYIANKVVEQFQMIPIYVNNDGSNSLNHFIKLLLEALFNELEKESWDKKNVDDFEVSLQESEFKLKEKSPLVEHVKHNFKEFLINITDKLKDKNGIFIVIDDINGLSEDKYFTRWYKSFTETVGFYDDKVPVIFTLVSCPDEFDRLCLQNESFSRIFNLIEIG